MGFWMLAGLLALLIGASLVMSAWRRRDGGDPTAAYDLQIYRDQLREIDRDVARGVLTEDEAGRIRTEVSRRVLEADRALQASTEEAHAARPQRIAVVALVAVTVAGSFALYYAVLGAPGVVDQPIETRIALIEQQRATRDTQLEREAMVPVQVFEDPDTRRAELVQQLRETMQEHPDEPEGLQLLAREEARVGNFVAARTAQAHRIEVLGDAAELQDYLDLAELMFMAAGGYVSPEGEALLNRVLDEDPRNGAARYYIGLMYAQQGRPDLGYPIWRNLLAESQPGDPWLPALRDRIEIVAAMAGDDVTLDQLPQPPMEAPFAPFAGPSQEDMAAAEDMSPEDRQAMIEGMVAGLSERLATEGGTPEEWARLIRAYMVLGQPERALPVYEEALSAFARSDAALEIIRAAGEGLETGDGALPGDAPLREPQE
jgi:cytochrome c-type biogenesis protein CcmH